MTDSNTVAPASTISDIKNNSMQRPTSLIVAQPSSPTTAVAPNTSDIKTPSPSKLQSPTTIIQIPPSPTQNKLAPNSPTSLEVSITSNAPQQTNSLSFMEMASSFFRWGGKGGNSGTTAQSDLVATKVEASPKSTTLDVEGSTTDPQTKVNKVATSDKLPQAPIINVITNPNDNVKVVSTVCTPNFAVGGVSGKHQRTSRKTMRAPQPPIADTPKIDSRHSNQGQTQHFLPSDAAEVQEKTEEKLLKLLSDFNSGKV